MGLSDYEQNVLKGLEQDLNLEDPKFTRGFVINELLSRHIVIGILIFIAGIIILLIGVSTNLFLGVLGFIVMCFGALRALPKSFHSSNE